MPIGGVSYFVCSGMGRDRYSSHLSLSHTLAYDVWDERDPWNLAMDSGWRGMRCAAGETHVPAFYQHWDPRKRPGQFAYRHFRNNCRNRQSDHPIYNIARGGIIPNPRDCKGTFQTQISCEHSI